MAWRGRARLAGASVLALLLIACTVPVREETFPEPAAGVPAPGRPLGAAAESTAPAAAQTPAPAPETASVGGPEHPGCLLLDQGLASWYGPGLHGRRTASGERFDRSEFTAAHRTLPFGTRVCVRSLVTGKTVMVRINDRGPFGADDRVVDLSQAAARELGMIGLGIKPVQLWQADEGETGCVPALGGEAMQAGSEGAAPPVDAGPISAQLLAPKGSGKRR